MRRALLVFLAAGAALADGERAFVEVTAARDAYFVHEPIRLRLRFGFDREFFRTHAVPLFVQALDVPVQVEAPWLRELPGAVPLAGPAPEGALRFALNGGLGAAAAAGERLVDGRAYAVLELERTYLPLEPGEIVVAAPELRYVHATRFAEDFIHGRVALDPRDASVRGAPLALAIRPLPDEGRPPEFDGAVGRFTVRAAADRTALDEGATFRLTLVIEGEGNLEAFPAPRLDGLTGFHVYGMIEERGAGRRTFVYELAPLGADVAQVPAIPFAFFDPGPPPGYRVARTAPLPLGVRARDGGEAPQPREPARLPWWAGVLAAALLLAAAAAAVRRRGRRRAVIVDRDLERVRAAGAALKAHVARPGPELADALAEFLAAQLRCPVAAVIGPDLPERLAAAGVPATLAAQAAGALERLVEARYGGGLPADAAAEVTALAAELQACFPRRG